MTGGSSGWLGINQKESVLASLFLEFTSVGAASLQICKTSLTTCLPSTR